MRKSNILDPVHPTLPELVWHFPDSVEPILKQEHALWIKKHIYEILDRAGYTNIEDWLLLCLTGSLTTYQYSEHSDVDVSLFIEANKVPDWSRAEMIGLMVENIDGLELPGTPYKMQVFVVDPSIKPHDLYKPGLRSGYDIDHHKWIEPPDKHRVYNVENEQNAFYTLALQQADKMEKLLRYEPRKAVQFYHQLHNKRKRDQAAGKGDASQSNIIWKFLEERELFPEDVSFPQHEEKQNDDD